MGNVESIKNILKKIRTQPVVIDNPAELDRFDAIILPGIGHFDEGMNRLKEQNWVKAIQTYHQEQRGILIGICLGMQLLAKNSQEGNQPGLAIVDAQVKKFPAVDNDGNALKIPHMGWNEVWQNRKPAGRFYFVHSYYFEPADSSKIYFSTHYGIEFCSAYHDNLLWGFQFHPEKSHRFGQELFKKVLKDFIV